MGFERVERHEVAEQVVDAIREAMRARGARETEARYVRPG
jgi:hypothetical protein